MQNLVVQDGYPDKFVLTWDRDPAITYEIRYKMKDAEGNFILIEPVLADEGAEPGQTQPFEYPLTHYDGSQGKNAVTSGDALRIEIAPFTDYQGDNHKAGNPESPDQLFYTLGTPAVTFDQTKTAADSITVTWPKIEKATSYEVTYAYGGVPGTTQILRDGVATTFADAYKADTQIIAVTKEEEIQVTDNITCVIPKPIGYDYMAYSGKDVTVTVKAINETRKTETTKTATTRTLGPAATGVSATVAAKESSIDVSWKEVPGATGYLIARTRYGATNTDDSRSTDGEFVYFYDTSAKKLTIMGQDEAQIDSKVALQDGTFTLADAYTDSTGVAMDNPTRKFRIEQDKLGWGYPYRYQVFPVKESTPSFVRADNLNQCTVGNVTYQDADKNYATGSAIGYGLDVKATKAESADTVTVTWTKPYLTGTNRTLNPVVYRKLSSDSGDTWKPLTSSIDDTTATMTIAAETADTKHKAYDYIVKYEETTSTSDTPYPFYLETQKGDGQEAANKGYYFTIQGADASKREITGNAEELTVTAYDWKERKNGPEAYKIYIKNNNIDGKWHLVATVPVTDKGYGVIIGENDTGITVSNPAGTVLRFTPEFTDDVHTKYLKVLRDYKHYYKIEAVRTITDSDGVETEITAVLGDDDSIWGARQITAKEFAYIASISVGDSLYNSDICSSSSKNYVWTFNFDKNNGPYLLSISGLMHSSRWAWLTDRPHTHGANYSFPDQVSEKAILSFKTKDASLLIDCSGSVEIENFSKDTGTFVVKYKSEILDFTNEARNYVPFR